MNKKNLVESFLYALKETISIGIGIFLIFGTLFIIMIISKRFQEYSNILIIIMIFSVIFLSIWRNKFDELQLWKTQM